MSMRLGKEQASGYVEDTQAAPEPEVKISDTERAPVAAEPDPAVAAG
jgi:hypothetical protein